MSPLNTRLPYRKINNLFYSFQMTNHILQKNSHMVMLWNDDIWIFYPWQSQQFPVNVVFGVFDIFTILGNIAIYFRHKPSYDLTAVVKKKIQKFDLIWDQISVFSEKGEKKKQFDQRFKQNYLPNWVTIYWIYIYLELSE